MSDLGLHCLPIPYKMTPGLYGLRCISVPKIGFIYASSADPDQTPLMRRLICQTPHNEASDLGLHCLPMSHKRTLGLYGLICIPVLRLIYLSKQCRP